MQTYDDREIEGIVNFPLLPQFVHEKEIQAEDDQVFLVKLQVRDEHYVLCLQIHSTDAVKQCISMFSK